MGHVTLTIAELRRPAEGKDRGIIFGTDGTKLGCFREKFALFQVGGTYDIEHSDGDYKNVKSVKPAAAQASPAKTNGNGYYRPTSPGDAERMFVCATLTAFIKAGKVEPELGKVTNAITVLRQAYARTFGGEP